MEERKGYCLKCRAEKSGRYCPNCGSEMVSEKPDAVCGRCRSPLGDWFNFCPGCALGISMAKAWKPGQAAPETPIAVGSGEVPKVHRYDPETTLGLCGVGSDGERNRYTHLDREATCSTCLSILEVKRAGQTIGLVRDAARRHGLG